MSPVFRHGRLRLYLLKLLDDAPKHGYEVIRLLQDRFMGVYAPSPGTIYPRLARLEEEGLVTHDEVDGRKVYKITDKGREEIRARMDDLAELEQEISDSVRDIAREVKEDVRETVRSLREEIARAARDVHREERRQAAEEMQRAHDEARRAEDAARGRARDQKAGGDPWDQATEWAREDDARREAEQARAEAGDQAQQARGDARDEARSARDDAGDEARPARDDARDEARPARDDARDQAEWVREQARRVRDEARRMRDESRRAGHREHDPRGAGRGPQAGRERAGEEAGARFRAGRGWSRRDWGDWSGLRDWPGWRDWPGLRDVPGWRDWPGSHDWPGPGRAPGWPDPAKFRDLWPDPAKFRDLERLALQFAGELRRVAAHASAIGEDTFGDLRAILDEALTKIRTEVFQPERPQGEGEPAPGGDAAPVPEDGTGPSPAGSEGQDSSAEAPRPDATPGPE